MLSIADQIFTLGGVAIGAAVSYLASSLGERARFRRDLARSWDERRLEAYLTYIGDVKLVHKLARRIAAARGLHDRDIPLSPDEGLPQLADAIARRSQSSEFVAILADRETVAALMNLNDQVRTLAWYARDMIPDPTPEGWDLAFSRFTRALDVFHEQIRSELAIPGKRALQERRYPRPAQPTQDRTDTPRV